jgi:hypothetical protein
MLSGNAEFGRVGAGRLAEGWIASSRHDLARLVFDDTGMPAQGTTVVFLDLNLSPRVDSPSVRAEEALTYADTVFERWLQLRVTEAAAATGHRTPSTRVPASPRRDDRQPGRQLPGRERRQPARRHPVLCLCREIVALRVMEKTGRLERDGDPSDAVKQGQVWWTRWVEDLRDDELLVLTTSI